MDRVIRTISIVAYNISQEEISDNREIVSAALSEILNNLKSSSSLDDYSIELTNLNMIYKFIKNECSWKRWVTESLDEAINDLTQMVYLKYRKLRLR